MPHASSLAANPSAPHNQLGNQLNNQLNNQLSNQLSNQPAYPQNSTLEHDNYDNYNDCGTCYRCPKCKQRVTVLVAASVVCCRCGRPMKHCQEPRVRS